MKAGKTKWFRSPVAAWNISESEKWLEEMAAQGWTPLNFAGEYGRFRQTEPAEIRFRLEPGRGESGGERQKREALYEEMGWQCVEFWGDYLVYCTMDPEVPELYTDAESRGLVWKKELKKLRRGVVINVLLWLVWGIHFACFFFMPGVFRYALELRAYTFSVLAVVLLLGWHIMMLVWHGKLLRRVHRQMEAGLEPTWEPAGANRLRRKWERIVTLLALALIVVGIVTSRTSDVRGDTLAPAQPLPYVPLTELAATAEPRNTHEYLVGDSIWMSERYQIDERAYDAESMRFRPSTEVYFARLRITALAEPLYRDLLREEQQMYLEGYITETVEDVRFDEAVLLEETYEDGAYSQTLVARRGSVVLRQDIYAGPEDAVDLGAHLDEFAAILAAWQ